jgi:hypothetical protein
MHIAPRSHNICCHNDAPCMNRHYAETYILYKILLFNPFVARRVANKKNTMGEKISLRGGYFSLYDAAFTLNEILLNPDDIPVHNNIYITNGAPEFLCLLSILSGGLVMVKLQLVCKIKD